MQQSLGAGKQFIASLRQGRGIYAGAVQQKFIGGTILFWLYFHTEKTPILFEKTAWEYGKL
jgi:hypothetical protein